MALGKYDRAREYLQLQSGNDYEKAGRVEIFLREGKEDQALQDLKSLPTTAFFGRQLMDPCLQHQPSAKGDVTGQQVRSALMAGHDPFPKYMLAAWDSSVGNQFLPSASCAEPSRKTTAPIRRWKQILCWPKFVRCGSLLKYAP